MIPKRALPTLFVALALVVAPAACSDDDTDDARQEVEDAAESAEENAGDLADEAGQAADEGQARVTAEALRTAVSSNDTAAEEGLRSVAALQEAADSLPGDPEVTGITDGDGDGLDDDGKVQVDQDDSSACLTLPEAADDSTQEGDDDGTVDAMGDIEVEGGAC